MICCRKAPWCGLPKDELRPRFRYEVKNGSERFSAHGHGLPLPGLGTIALYAPALTFGFVNYDDEFYVINNPHVNHGLTGGGLAGHSRPGYAANWHPLTWLSHMMDVQFFGLRAGGHHATSVPARAQFRAFVPGVAADDGCLLAERRSTGCLPGTPCTWSRSCVDCGTQGRAQRVFLDALALAWPATWRMSKRRFLISNSITWRRCCFSLWD